MENILLIHMGMPKTGTTALQSFLYENQYNLENNGWCYPDLLKEMQEITLRPGRAYINGAIFYKEKKEEKKKISHRLEGNIIISTKDWDEVWERIAEYLEDKNVIISEELLWNNAKEFLECAKEKYNNIKVVVYLRRQDQAIESFWNQQIKYKYGAYSVERFEEFVPLHVEEYHYLKKLEQISSIIGKENLIVRVYEKEQLNGNNAIALDFLSILGIEPDWEKWKNCQALNSGLYGNYIEIMRIINSLQCVGYLNPPQFRKKFADLSHFFSKSAGGYFTPQERKNFMSQFALENIKIAREYLHRKEGILFYNDQMDIPQQEIHHSTSFEEDLIRAFSAMVYSQMEEIQQLKSHSCMLAETLLLYHNIKGRKLLLFGAGQKCAALLEQIKLPVELIADNNVAMRGKRLKGIEIVYAKEIVDWSEYFIIITCIKSDEIETQLQEQGLKIEKDYILAKKYFVC